MATENDTENPVKALSDLSCELDSMAIVAELAAKQLGTDREAVGVLDMLTREAERASQKAGAIGQHLRNHKPGGTDQ